MRQISFTHSIVMLLTLLVLLGVSRSGMQAQSISDNDVYAVAWSPDGSKIVGGGRNGFLTIWDSAGQVLLSLTGISTDVRAVAWSPDSSKIVSGSQDHVLRVWNVVTGQLLGSMLGHQSGLQSVAWSPDGTKIASAGFEEYNGLRVWDAITYQQIVMTRTSFLFTVQWRPDNLQLVVTDGEGGLNTYNADLTNWNRLGSLSGIGLGGLSRSPDDTKLVTGNSDGSITIWDATTGEVLQTLIGHTRPVNSVAWGAREHIASSSLDGTVRVWDAATGREIRRYTRPPIINTAIAWNPSGTRLAFGSTEGNIRIETVFRAGAELRQRWGRHPTAGR